MVSVDIHWETSEFICRWPTKKKKCFCPIPPPTLIGFFIFSIWQIPISFIILIAPALSLYQILSLRRNILLESSHDYWPHGEEQVGICWWNDHSAFWRTATFWNLNLILKEISASVNFFDFAREIWLDLQECYKYKNCLQVYQIRWELTTLVQDWSLSQFIMPNSKLYGMNWNYITWLVPMESSPVVE